MATFWALFGNFGPLFIPTAGHTVSRLFYNHPLTRTLCRLVDVLSDVQKFRVADDGRLFANALHHSAKTSFLQNLLYSHYIARWAIYITYCYQRSVTWAVLPGQCYLLPRWCYLGGVTLVVLPRWCYLGSAIWVVIPM